MKTINQRQEEGTELSEPKRFSVSKPKSKEITAFIILVNDQYICFIKISEIAVQEERKEVKSSKKFNHVKETLIIVKR